MKKIIVFFLLMFTVFNVGYSATNKKSKSLLEKKLEKEKKNKEIILKKNDEKFRKEMKKFELEATIKTNKGNINIYLYPEAAPLNVANFVYLAKNNFYNGLMFHRVIPNALVQTGDPKGDGSGTTGYSINDEIVDWLSFDLEGKVAMANSGPNTNSSQFFITISPLEQLNEKYTIIGEIINRDDMSTLKVIRAEDRIISIDIKGKKVNNFLNYFQNEVKQWNSILKNK